LRASPHGCRGNRGLTLAVITAEVRR